VTVRIRVAFPTDLGQPVVIEVEGDDKKELLEVFKEVMELGRGSAQYTT